MKSTSTEQKVGPDSPDAISRRSFLQRSSLLAACGTAALTGGVVYGDSDLTKQVDSTTTALHEVPPITRQEWKRREIHPATNWGWGQAHYASPRRGIPETVRLFSDVYDSGKLLELLLENATKEEVVYTFRNGAFIWKTENVMPIAALLDSLGYRSRELEQIPFVSVRSQSRSEILQALPPEIQSGIVDPDYRFVQSFPASAALDKGSIVFDVVDDKLVFYSWMIAGYASRAFVKYFAELDFVEEYEGPSGTSHTDNLLDKLPVDQYFNLATQQPQVDAPLTSMDRDFKASFKNSQK